MMVAPLVSVICVCYNQGRFVEEAMDSVLSQTHPRIQLLVVDDGSTDNSAEIIRNYAIRHPGIEFLPISQNSGYCKAFNYGLAYAKGEFLIDFAADDILVAERIEKGVRALGTKGDRYGVNFTDAWWVAEDGRHLFRHSDRFPHHTIPEGDIYENLIGRFFICSPTMMFSREVIDYLNGYDESLRYEDFDFWIRSSRVFYYCYTPEVLVKKRVVANSMSHKQFKVLSPQLRSTFRVCEKIMALNRSAAEQKALARRLLYEMSVCVRLLHFPLVIAYARLYLKNRAQRYQTL